VEGAVRVANLIQLEVQRLAISHLRSQVSDSITLSLGISTSIPDRQIPADFLVSVADRALYAAKEKGRNCYYVLSL
ncbi:MAG: diguanylate cyclase domain-containing protein, partial [Xenococcaceae cyanobacterium]